MKIFSGTDWRLRLLQLTIILIPFSYWPRLYISSIEGLNLEFSLVQLAALSFVAASLLSLRKNLSKFWDMTPLKVLAALVSFNWLSLLWSADISRSVVLSAYWTFLLVLVCAIIGFFKDKKPKQKQLTNPLIWSGIIAAGFGLFQFFMVVIGVDEGISLIRHAYNDELFGFARIHAFALEPQFFANAMIAPIAYLAWRKLKPGFQTYHALLLVIFFAVFLLTVSRGGTLGLILCLAIIVGYNFKLLGKEAIQRTLHLAGLLFIGLALALTAVFISATVNPKHDGVASIEIFLDQISHGVIDISLANSGQGVDGLVESSTTGRLYMVERGLEISALSPRNYIIGVGVGSFGPVFQQTFNSKIGNHVINNQYAEFFVELGIIGLGLFLAFVFTANRQVVKSATTYKVLLLGIFAAYLVQYLFFSLQTNVLHVWLFVGVVLALSQKRVRK